MHEHNPIIALALAYVSRACAVKMCCRMSYKLWCPASSLCSSINQELFAGQAHLMWRSGMGWGNVGRARAGGRAGSWRYAGSKPQSPSNAEQPFALGTYAVLCHLQRWHRIN